MKPPDETTPQGIMARLYEAEAELREKAKALEKDYLAIIKEKEKLKPAAEANLAKARKVHEDMKADYNKLLADEEATARKELEAKALMKEDVREGRVSLADYYANGKHAAQIDAEAKAAADIKCFDMLKIVREKGKAVIEAEVELLGLQCAIDQALTAPSFIWIQNLDEFVKHAKEKIAYLLGRMDMPGWPATRYALEDKKNELLQANGHPIAEGDRWNSLDAAALREMKLDPKIPIEWIPQIDEAIRDLGPGEKVDVLSRHSGSLKGLQIITLGMPKGCQRKEVIP